MPNIYYDASNFPASYGTKLTGTHCLSINMDVIVWAAISMGKPGIAYLFSHGLYSVSDMIVRAHTVYANLRLQGHELVKSSLYEQLDPSEKGATSYFLGMMATKILCAGLLKTPWMFHLSMLRSLGGTAILRERSSPDLIGLDSRWNWIVAEAKGRSNSFDADAMFKAKNQTMQLRFINRRAPSLRVAVQSYFSPELTYSISDPEEYAEGAPDVDFEIGLAMKDYYSFLFNIPDERADHRSLNGQAYVFLTIKEVGVEVGISETLLTHIERGDFSTSGLEKMNGIISQQQQLLEVDVFPDGLVVQLDQRWSEEQMRREPLSRK